MYVNHRSCLLLKYLGFTVSYIEEPAWHIVDGSEVLLQDIHEQTLHFVLEFVVLTEAVQRGHCRI